MTSTLKFYWELFKALMWDIQHCSEAWEDDGALHCDWPDLDHWWSIKNIYYMKNHKSFISVRHGYYLHSDFNFECYVGGYFVSESLTWCAARTAWAWFLHRRPRRWRRRWAAWWWTSSALRMSPCHGSPAQTPSLPVVLQHTRFHTQTTCHYYYTS